MTNKLDNTARVLSHVEAVGHIDTASALLNLGMSGGTLTKVISDIKRGKVYTVKRAGYVNPVTKTRTSFYYITKD